MAFVTAADEEIESNSSLIERGLLRCSLCRTVKSLDGFNKNKNRRNGYSHSCSACNRAHMAKWYADNREKAAAINRTSRYGLSPERYEQMFAAQDERCAICGADDHKGRGWNVDHDHACCPGRKACGNCIRGILCNKCNTALGLLDDDPGRLLAAANYLRDRSVDLTYSEQGVSS